jgi:hypothetical protein
MSGDNPVCRHARLAIGGDPQHLPAEVTAHLPACADCSRFHAETLALDGRLRAALELPLPQFRRRASPVRRYALAASLLLAVTLAGGIWLLRPQPALAGEVLAHVKEEAGSWDQHELLPASAVADVLQKAGVEFDARLPVVYASACPFHGRLVPHLVVQTESGPMTVMLLAHEKIAARQEFSENGYSGVLLPAGEGSVAVLMRGAAVPAAAANTLLSGVRWR